MLNIHFEPIGRRQDCPAGQSLLDSARQMNVDLVSICGGAGTCGRCKIQLMEGEISEPTAAEKTGLTPPEQELGFRLACQAYPLSNVKVQIPPASLTAPQRTQVEGLEVNTAPDPTVTFREVQLEAPKLENPIADESNLAAALGITPGKMDFHILQSLSTNLRALNWSAGVALRGEEILAIQQPGLQWLGLAVDIGTTKIAGYLVDMRSGKTLASKGMMNPQISYGEDVVSRISAAGKSPEAALKMQSLLVETLNEMSANLCRETGNGVTQITDCVVVGNTAIHHLFLHLPVKQLGLAPYIPAVRAGIDIKAREIGLKLAGGAYMHLLPNVAGYVGADHVAMLLATRMAEAQATTLAIDIGTNTEICLKHNGQLHSVSCASGPAFEGAHIKFGMRAAPGAIEHIILDGDSLRIQTIGGGAAVGICGSGLVDGIAQLRLNNILDKNGRMGPHGRVRSTPTPEFILVKRPGEEPISITQKDVRELQLAKAAIRVGIQALTSQAGITESDIQQVLIAGAFGTYIDVSSAISIGMLPPLPPDRFTQVGNAAGTGAHLALISKGERAKADEIARLDGYIELALLPNFQRKFAEACYL